MGEYTVLHNHGLYWSYEENQGPSHDMHASVIVFKGEERVFAGRGYKYLEFKTELEERSFSFLHWTGTMGDSQITSYHFTIDANKLKVTTRKRSTKE